MSSASANEVSAFYGDQARQVNALLAQHRETKAKLDGAAAALDGEIAIAQDELAAIYLPAFSDEALARAAQLTGFQGFTRRDPRVALAAERKALQAKVATLDADDRYVRRDVLVGEAGTLQQELDASNEALEPLAAAVARFESLPSFDELIAIGYATPGFKEHWWNAGYWHHHSVANHVCKALDMADFHDDVLPAYRAALEPRDVMRADVARIAGEIAAVNAVVAERDQAADRLAHLDEIYLDSAQKFLGEHLGHADLALLEQWIANEPELRAFQQGLRRLAGVQAKRKIVEEIAQQGVPKVVADLEERKARAITKAQRYGRPKYAYQSFPREQIDPAQNARFASLAAQNQKLQARLDRMLAYDDYNRFALTNDSSLWWLYFMDSSPSRYYTPSLFDFYQRNPGLAVVEDTSFAADTFSSADAVGAAVAAGELEGEQGTYVS